MVLPAVDVDRDDLPGGLLDPGKDRADGGGLPGSRGAAEDGISRGSPPEGGVDEEGKFPGLGIAVGEVFGEVGGIEDIDIPKESLVVAKRMTHRVTWGGRFYLSGRRAG